jgi:hypothetical protein
MKNAIKSMSYDMSILGMKVEKTLVIREDIEAMKQQMANLKMRDDLIWEELMKKDPQ